MTAEGARPSVVSQRDGRVDPGRTTCRDVARQQCDQSEHAGDRTKCDRIVRLDVIKKPGNEAREAERAQDPEHQAIAGHERGAVAAEGRGRSRRLAPSAILMPIFAVRCVTLCAITPKIPIDVSSSASAPNVESSQAPTRVRHIASSTRSRIVFNSVSGRFGSSSREVGRWL
jgi:hypothetical protein